MKTKYACLGEMLDKHTLEQTQKILDECNRDGIDFTDTVCINRLKLLFGNVRKNLWDKGVDADYLAYAVAYMAKQIKESLVDR